MGVKPILKALLRKNFEFVQGLGFDLLPRHFYSEVPNIKKLRTTDSWKKPYSLVGISGISTDEQLEYLRQWVSVPGKQESSSVHEIACNLNNCDGFGKVEAQTLYHFVLKHKPKQIIQIGAGVSTAVIQLAATDAGYRPEQICVDPFPNSYLKKEHLKGTLQLRAIDAIDLPLEELEKIKEEAFFFVDSSHTLGPAGEVTRVILEMLPRLPKTTWVHFHDITLPYDYDRHIMKKSLFFSHETSLLTAFLTMNPSFQVICSLSLLHYQASEELKKLIPLYSPATNDNGLEDLSGHFPSSLYLRKIA